MSTDTKKVTECQYIAIDTEAGSVTAGKWLLPFPHLGSSFFPGDISESGVILVLVARDSSSVCSLHTGGLKKLCLLPPCTQALWSAFCEHQQTIIPFSLNSRAELQAAHLPLSLSVSCPSSIQGTLYLYHSGSLSVYIIAIYNRLIHL